MRTQPQIDAIQRAIDRHSYGVYELGKHDCAILAADCMMALGCPDPMAEVRGYYHSARQLSRLLTSLGYRGKLGFVEAWCERNEYPRIPSWATQVGDLGLTRDMGFCVRTSRTFISIASSGLLVSVEPVHSWAIQWTQ